MSKPGSKPSRGRPRTLDVERVRDVAMTAYWRGDPADVSVNAICELAGVSKPSLYREFGSEDGLTRAVLDSYVDLAFADVLAILQSRRGLLETLDALVDFACADPRMENGCLFYKLRAGKHRLGPETRARIDEIDMAAQAVYKTFLQNCSDAGDLPAGIAIEAGARYLAEQIALAVTQRASGEDPTRVRDMLKLALSVFSRRDSAAPARAG